MVLFPLAIETRIIREVVMATAGIVCLPYGMACTECSHPLIAPKWSGYVSKHEVRHFWSCENCGHEIEVRVNLRINAVSGSNKSLGSAVVV